MSTAMTPMPRHRFALPSLLVALVLSVLLGTLLGPEVAAREKNTFGSVKKAVAAQRESCEDVGGGTLTVRTTPKGNAVTTCTGGGADGTTCTITKKYVHCSHQTDAPPPQDVGGPPSEGGNEQPSDAPPQAGGGASVEPGGGSEQPTDPGTGDGGGHQAGGGAGVEPGGGIEQPGDPGDGSGVVLTAAHGEKRLHAAPPPPHPHRKHPR